MFDDGRLHPSFQLGNGFFGALSDPSNPRLYTDTRAWLWIVDLTRNQYLTQWCRSRKTIGWTPPVDAAALRPDSLVGLEFQPQVFDVVRFKHVTATGHDPRHVKGWLRLSDGRRDGLAERFKSFRMIPNT
jgi:hypothetical protein